MARLTRCRACGHSDLYDFLDLGSTPLADAFPTSAAEPEPTYPLGLTVCERCWLVQNIETVPDAALWTADYGFYTGASPASIAYFAEYARWTLDRFAEQARRGIVEVASNDGTLLRHFVGHGRVIGVDPSPNVAAASGLPTIVEPFGRAVADGIGPTGLVIANNVVAHVADLDDFLGGVAILIGTDGVALLEFQYVGDLIARNQFDHVYHEHRSFFSLHSLAEALRPHGLGITDTLWSPAQGGSYRVVLRAGGTDGNADERWLARRATYETFADRVAYLRQRLLDLIDRERSEGRRLAGYAASAKSTTLLNYCGIGPDRLQSVVDLTPHKIGRVTPGTHVPIVAADDSVDTYLLLAWNYLSSVIRRERDFIDRGGRFIVPVPMPVLV